MRGRGRGLELHFLRAPISHVIGGHHDHVRCAVIDGRSHALHHHVKAAITNGATEEEIRETLLHIIPYSGFPAAFDAFEVAEKALRGEDDDD